MKQPRHPWPTPGSALPDRILRDGWWLADPRRRYDLSRDEPLPPQRPEPTGKGRT